jgi:prepilin-type N-terminal cleavage/methylation domain-containing protein
MTNYSTIRNSKSAWERGFTLIEIIVVIVILSIVSAITIKFLVDSLKIYTMTVNQKTLLDEGKLGLERMCRDIRDANTINSPAAGNSASAITFIRDDATAQDGAGETITFQLSTTTLQKVKTSPAATSNMVDYVNAFTVTRGATATNNLNEITLVLNLLRTTGENMTLQTRVYPKNLARDTTYTYKNFIQNWQEAYQ